MGRYEPLGGGVNRVMLVLVLAVAAGCLWLLAVRGSEQPLGDVRPAPDPRTPAVIG